MDGRSVLITGGGNGIGRAAALAFAREGARVAVADLDAGSAAATVAMIAASGGEAIALHGDVTHAADVETMIARIGATFGRLDGAFNNAGVAPQQVGSISQRTHAWSEASFDRIVAANLKSVWLCMKYEIVRMLSDGGGSIVNMSSVAGLAGLPLAAGYAAAKHGVIGLTKTAALEYAADGIRVNAVCPGFVETRMTRLAVRMRGGEIEASTPMGRLGQPEEIAELVVWLCSDRASYVTGAAFAVDGGITAA